MANVGIIGHGVVGSGVADILWNSREVLARRAGETIELQRVCDLRDFPAAPYADRMTKDAEQIYAADDIDIVVECHGQARARPIPLCQGCCWREAARREPRTRS